MLVVWGIWWKKRSNQRLISRVKSNFYCRVGVSKKAKKILKANLYQSGYCWNKAFLNALCSLFNWNIRKELSHLKFENNEFLCNFLKYTFFLEFTNRLFQFLRQFLLSFWSHMCDKCWTDIRNSTFTAWLLWHSGLSCCHNNCCQLTIKKPTKSHTHTALMLWRGWGWWVAFSQQRHTQDTGQ